MPTSRAGKAVAAGFGRNSGVTLLELLVVMMVIALIMAMAAPALERSLPGAKFRAGIADLRSELQRARNAAIMENRETWVLLDSEAGEYRRSGATSARQLPDGVSLSFVTARRELTSEQAGRIRFFPDGTSTGGSVHIAFDGQVRTIEIDWFDGRITSNGSAPE